MFDFNVNNEMNNQPNPYTGPLDGASGPTTIHRRGPVTYWRGTGNLTASRIIAPGTIVAEGWTLGDVVYISAPAHTGGGFTLTLENLAAGVLATWPALISNGAMLYFNGTDFEAITPGNSTT